MFQHPTEHLVRQQIDVFSEHAEDQSIYKVRDSVGLMPVVAQLLRQLGELTGRLLVSA